MRQREKWAAWLDFCLYRRTPYEIGSVDAVAFFLADFLPHEAGRVPAEFLPREREGRLYVGGSGTAASAFRRPAGLALDPAGNIVVADSLNNRVQVFSPEGEWRAASSPALRLREPWGVAVDGAGNVYVADTGNHRIQKLDRELRPLQAWGGAPASPPTSPPGPLELSGPRGIAVDADGNVWVSDTGHSRVLKFGPSGEPLGAFGELGSGPGQFRQPVGITSSRGGEILVADQGNGRVQRFDSGFRYLGEYRVRGWEDRTSENRPYLAVLPDGSLLVTVPEEGALERIAPGGEGLQRIEGWSESGGARPLGVLVDRLGRVWVAEAAGSQLVRLSLP